MTTFFLVLSTWKLSSTQKLSESRAPFLFFLGKVPGSKILEIMKSWSRILKQDLGPGNLAKYGIY